MPEGNKLCKDHLTLIISHIAFATRLARKFYRERPNVGVELDDFVSAALLGLCDAARRFDPSKGENFHTFGYFRIRGAMYDLLRRGGGISRSCFAEVELHGEHAFADECPGASSFGKAQDVHELAQLAAVIEQTGIKLHLAPNSEIAEISYANKASPETAAMNYSTRCYLRRILADLPQREREIIERRYFADQTFEEMAELFGGVSKSWICRLHSRALSSLRTRMLRDNSSAQRRIAEYLS